jgi:hypothetical protein
MDLAETIWNRAIFSGGGGSPEIGDIALATAITFHGLAMNGGVLDAVERKSADLSRVEDAYQWLGLGQIAALLEAVRQDVAAGALDDDDRAEALEHAADQRYQTILPSDEVLYAAFRARLAKDPGAFAGSAASDMPG